MDDSKVTRVLRHFMANDYDNSGFSLSIFAVLFLAFTLVRVFGPRRTRTSPHDVPYKIPFLKSTISFVFKGHTFLPQISRQSPYGSTLRVQIVTDEVYLVQGPKNVIEFFQNARLTVTRGYSLVLAHCFGMEQKAVDAYLADTSGSREKPIPGSEKGLKAEDRLTYRTHAHLTRGLLTNDMGCAAEKFVTKLGMSLSDELINLPRDGTWVDSTDLSYFFERHHGAALVRSLFGDAIIDNNPGFVDDLWTFDHGLMNLSRRFPRLLTPKIYAVRDKLVDAVKRWQARALALSQETGDDSAWGTTMMKERYETLSASAGQNEASVASTNLALMWAAITNVVPSSMTLALHIYSDPTILASIRSSLRVKARSNDDIPSCGVVPCYWTMMDLESIPLLVSMYAEVLRFGVQIHIPRNAPYHHFDVGNVVIPPGKLIITNTSVAHHDESVWDTRGGARALDRFVPERFLVDPMDPESGPARKKGRDTGDKDDKSVYFSTAGLEGAWIPFGGGQHACPGRILAKRIMLLSTAILIHSFDIEILNSQPLKWGCERYGFGVAKPAEKVRFRIRRRQYLGSN